MVRVVKRLCLFGGFWLGIVGSMSILGILGSLGKAPVSPVYSLSPVSPLKSPNQSPREAHHTIEVKLRKASTLLRFGRTSKIALLSPLTFICNLSNNFVILCYQ